MCVPGLVLPEEVTFRLKLSSISQVYLVGSLSLDDIFCWRSSLVWCYFEDGCHHPVQVALIWRHFLLNVIIHYKSSSVENLLHFKVILYHCLFRWAPTSIMRFSAPPSFVFLSSLVHFSTSPWAFLHVLCVFHLYDTTSPDLAAGKITSWDREGNFLLARNQRQ